MQESFEICTFTAAHGPKWENAQLTVRKQVLFAIAELGFTTPHLQMRTVETVDYIGKTFILLNGERKIMVSLDEIEKPWHDSISLSEACQEYDENAKWVNGHLHSSSGKCLALIWDCGSFWTYRLGGANCQANSCQGAVDAVEKYLKEHKEQK